MILILGKNGYVSKRFQNFFDYKGIEYRAASISTRAADAIEVIVKALQPKLVINCMGYTGKPNVDACEDNKEECLYVNVSLAELAADICRKYDIPFGHVSSGCIYQSEYTEAYGTYGAPWDDIDGDWDDIDGDWKFIDEFSEADAPNFTFLQKNCSFYSGTKALAENIIRKSCPKHYLWRLRMPFNHIKDQKNYIYKILTYPKVWSIENSLTNIDEFVQTCYYSWVKEVPYGTYNIVNPDAVTAKEVIELAQSCGVQGNQKYIEYFNSIEELNKIVKAPRSNCVLRPDKIMNEGFGLLPAMESLKLCFQNWNSTEVSPFWN